MNVKLKLALSGAVLIVLALGAWRCYAVGYDRGKLAEAAEWRKKELETASAIEADRQKQQAEIDAIDKLRDEELQGWINKAQTATEALNAERKKHPIYSARLPASGVQSYNDAIRAASNGKSP